MEAVGTSKVAHKKRKVTREDRLSSLPDTLLVNILSLLPIKTAAATSILSKQWRNLWTQVPGLSFYDWFTYPILSKRKKCAKFDTFSAATDSILCKLTSPKLDHLVVHFIAPPRAKVYRKRFRSNVRSLVRHFCSRNVERIELEKLTGGIFEIRLPPCILQCQSLVTLELDGLFDIKVHDAGSISLPNLKKLFFSAYVENRELVMILFKSCPALEDLTVTIRDNVYGDQEEFFVEVSCPRLKQMIVDLPWDCKFRIDTPHLESVHLDGSARFYQLVQPVKSLQEAHIDIEKYDDSKSVSKHVQWVSSVRFLELTIGFKDAFVCPIFHNLVVLEVCLKGSHVSHSLNCFLQCCPNLQTLDLNFHPRDSHHMTWVLPDSAPPTRKLRSMKIGSMARTVFEFRYLQYILEIAPVLELLLVEVHNAQSNNNSVALYSEMQFRELLLSTSRASPVCEIGVSQSMGEDHLERRHL